MAPTLPPRMAVRNSVFSGMRQASRFALDLSTPMRINPARLTAANQIAAIKNSTCSIPATSFRPNSRRVYHFPKNLTRIFP